MSYIPERVSLKVFKNGVWDKQLADNKPSGGSWPVVGGAVVVDANGVDDYFEVFVYTNDACNIYGDSERSHFTGRKV